MFIAEMELVENFVTRPDPTVRATGPTGRNHDRSQTDRYFDRFHLWFIEYFYNSTYCITSLIRTPMDCYICSYRSIISTVIVGTIFCINICWYYPGIRIKRVRTNEVVLYHLKLRYNRLRSFRSLSSERGVTHFVFSSFF